MRRRPPGSSQRRSEADFRARVEGLEARSLLTAAWSAPAPIVYGTALSWAELDATAAIPGTFTYSPAAGTILGAGVHTLSVTFAPSDSVNYTSASATATITVAKATPTVGITDDSGVYDGSPFAATASLSGVDGASGSSLEGVEPVLTYYAGGTPIAGAPTEVGTYTVVASFPGSADYTSASSPSITFNIAAAPTAVSLGASTASTTFGQSVTLTAIVSATDPGAGTPTGTVTFWDGATALGSIPLDASGRAVLSIGGLSVGDHTITAAYGGDADRSEARSGAAVESVGAAGTRIALVPQPLLKGKHVTALSLTAEVEPLTPGGGLPIGVATFRVGRRPLGTAAINGGRATLAVKPARVLNKPITVTYGGGVGFLPSSIASSPLTTRALAAMARASHVRPAARPADRAASKATVSVHRRV